MKFYNAISIQPHSYELFSTSLTVSREPRRDEKINGYLDFEAPELCPRFDIYMTRI